MTSIAALVSDLTDKIKDIPAFQGRVGFTAGGKPGDPTMRDAKMPAAWVVYDGDVPRTTTQNLTSTPVTHLLVVKILVPYKDENFMNTVSYPAIQDVIHAATGTPIGSISGYCARWSYLGQTVEELNDRMVFVQRYSVQGTL